MISISGKEWKEYKTPKRLIDKYSSDFDKANMEDNYTMASQSSSASSSYEEDDSDVLQNHVDDASAGNLKTNPPPQPKNFPFLWKQARM